MIAQSDMRFSFTTILVSRENPAFISRMCSFFLNFGERASGKRFSSILRGSPLSESAVDSSGWCSTGICRRLISTGSLELFRWTVGVCSVCQEMLWRDSLIEMSAKCAFLTFSFTIVLPSRSLKNENAKDSPAISFSGNFSVYDFVDSDHWWPSNIVGDFAPQNHSKTNTSKEI
jgi:hypothetical protein